MRTYDTDYAGWAEDTARAIAGGDWSAIDRLHLADEVLDLARKERREIRNRFRVLILHLLKQRFQPGKASRSWEQSIAVQRIELRDLFEENPSLATPGEISGALAKAYRLARLEAAGETGLAVEAFPQEMPFTDSEIWG